MPPSATTSKRKAVALPDSPPPTKRPVGRPRKAPKKTAPIPPPTIRIPVLRARAVSSSDSDVVLNMSLDDDQSASATPTDADTDNDPELRAATEALLGLAGQNKQQVVVIVSEGEDDDEDEVQVTAPHVEEEEEEEAYEEEEEEEDSEFLVDFLVPGDDGAADEMIFLSTVPASRFFRKVAEAMEVDRDDVNIAYRFSTWKAADLSRKLKTAAHLETLFTKAKTAMEDLEASNSKVRKQFQVTIVNLEPKEKKGKKEKEKGKGKKTQKKKKRYDSSDSKDADDEPKRKSGADYLRDLQAKHKCDKHTGFCLVASDGEHVPLGDQKMSLWSLLMVDGGHKSITEPPAVLSIDLKGTKAAAPTCHANKPTAHPDAPYPPYNYYHQPPLGVYPPYYPPHVPHAPPPIPDAAPANLVPTPPAPHTSLRKGPSLDSQADVPPTLYPKIEDWLLDLDTSERGEDGHGFHRFGPMFREHGYARVIQLADEGEGGVKAVREMCPEMPNFPKENRSEATDASSSSFLSTFLPSLHASFTTLLQTVTMVNHKGCPDVKSHCLARAPLGSSSRTNNAFVRGVRYSLGAEMSLDARQVAEALVDSLRCVPEDAKIATCHTKAPHEDLKLQHKVPSCNVCIAHI
ncbi:hypothetical protein B0H16DRAFT_1749885 [Mycena metata]|uniref:Uncharacterized protein n=1 Tax=Mycena metata TaxID=1033252 RepID=A0AAD7DSF4_9AGAR|nr:hypothetical protein B0H16DRAFT_1749885 [Mycena metata]